MTAFAFALDVFVVCTLVVVVIIQARALDRARADARATSERLLHALVASEASDAAVYTDTVRHDAIADAASSDAADFLVAEARAQGRMPAPPRGLSMVDERAPARERPPGHLVGDA